MCILKGKERIANIGKRAIKTKIFFGLVFDIFVWYNFLWKNFTYQYNGNLSGALCNDDKDVSYI